MARTVPSLKEVDYVESGREEMASKTVNHCIAIYERGHLPSALQHMGSWMGFDMTAELTWPQRHQLLAEILYDSSQKFGGLVNKALQYSALCATREEYRKVFAKAQQDCGFTSSREEVQAALETLQSQRLTDFDNKPFKAASVAQVHLAQWDGQDAVVKIVHSKVKQTYEADLEIMVKLAEKVNSSQEAKGIYPTLSAVAARLRRVVAEETNLTIEAENQFILSEGLAGFPQLNIVVAEVYSSTTSILVMEQLKGITAHSAERMWGEGEAVNVFGPEQRERLYRAYALMCLHPNFASFHADAHPGNFMVLQAPDGSFTETLAILDFGQVNQRSPEVDVRFLDWCRRAPLEEPNERNVKSWLHILGIQPQEGKAMEVAGVLFDPTHKGQMFPDLKEAFPEEFVSYIFLLQYLAQFELNAGRARQGLNLEDAPKATRVLQIFKDIAEQIP